SLHHRRISVPRCFDQRRRPEWVGSLWIGVLGKQLLHLRQVVGVSSVDQRQCDVGGAQCSRCGQSNYQSLHNSASAPVLSPRLSIGTSALFKNETSKFVIGVRSAYRRWRFPWNLPEHPPAS